MHNYKCAMHHHHPVFDEFISKLIFSLIIHLFNQGHCLSIFSQKKNFSTRNPSKGVNSWCLKIYCTYCKVLINCCSVWNSCRLIQRDCAPLKPAADAMAREFAWDNSRECVVIWRNRKIHYYYHKFYHDLAYFNIIPYPAKVNIASFSSQT
jgi:hypothetical protein